MVISGDERVRKPAPEIFDILLQRLRCHAGDVVYVDDNEANLDSAAAAGMRTVMYAGSDDRGPSVGHRSASSPAEPRELISPVPSVGVLQPIPVEELRQSPRNQGKTEAE